MKYPLDKMNGTYKKNPEFLHDLKNVLEGNYYIISKQNIGIDRCFFPQYWKLS